MYISLWFHVHGLCTLYSLHVSKCRCICMQYRDPSHTDIVFQVPIVSPDSPIDMPCMKVRIAKLWFPNQWFEKRPPKWVRQDTQSMNPPRKHARPHQCRGIPGSSRVHCSMFSLKTKETPRKNVPKIDIILQMRKGTCVFHMPNYTLSLFVSHICTFTHIWIHISVHRILSYLTHVVFYYHASERSFEIQ